MTTVRAVCFPGPVLLMLPVLLLLASCRRGESSDDRPVARAFDERLLWSDLRQVIPIGTSPQDSAALAQHFIRNWLRQRAVLHQAELNLTAQAKDFEAQLRDYRNSLVIYAYEQALVQQKLDTTVHLQEMVAYHQENGANFELREPVARVRWVKIRENDKKIMRRLEEAFMSGYTERMHELEMWMAQRGLSFVDRADSWTTESDLRREMGLDAAFPGTLTAPRRMIQKQGQMAWFIDILELRTPGGLAPLELVRQDIRSIIMNQRKIQLLEKMREDLYREAVEKQNIEIL